jgi:hypothetical protein
MLLLLGMVSLLGYGCADEPQSVTEEEEVTMEDEGILPVNAAEETLLAWFEALAKHPAGNLNSLTEITENQSFDTLISPYLSLSQSLMDLRCIESGDTAVCYFAIQDVDQLKLDSLTLLRRDNTWKVLLKSRI